MDLKAELEKLKKEYENTTHRLSEIVGAIQFCNYLIENQEKDDEANEH